MVKYITLWNWTEQGLRNVKDTTQRAHAAREMIASLGGKLTDIYWTFGQYDLVTVLEAPDEETALRIGLQVGMQGNLQGATLRAFDEQEVGRVVGKLR